MSDLMDDCRRVVNTGSEYVAAGMVDTETRLAVRQTFEMYLKSFSDLGKSIDSELIRLRAALENQERSNLYLHSVITEAETSAKEVRRLALDQAARTHESRVAAIRSNPASYKNGKITKSAKRASDFHERSSQVIRALGAEDGE